MNSAIPSVPVEPDDEISALIDTLHQSMQRLEVLTGGEVDAVADQHGRTFVLQRAQERLRLNEATRQAAVLNALPAHIAMLDAQGIIVSVNDAWKRFGDANALLGTGHGIGVNYLAECEAARGDDAAQAWRAAAGIRSVMDGTASSFSLEYPCHSPAQQRWFMMTVTPLNEEHRTGAVVMHLDISERRRAEYALEDLSQKTEQRERILSTALASISDFAYIYDRDARFLFANQPLLDLWGITLDEVVGKGFLELGYPQDVATQLERDVQQVFHTKASVTGELPYTSPSGLFGIYEYIFSPVINGDGNVDLVVGSSRDVTARRLAIEAIRISEQEQRQLAEQLEIERSRLVAAQRVAKIGSWETDLGARSVIWSEETHRIHETDPANFQPTHLGYLDLTHPGDRKAIKKAFVQSLRGNWVGFVEHRVLLPGGRTKVLEERWSVSFDQSGKAIRAIGTCQDITDRKEAEAVRERLALILESTPDMVGISDSAGRVLYLNYAGRDALGVGQQENIAHSYMADFTFDPPNHPAFTEGIPTALRDGNWSGESILVSRDGKEIPVSQVIIAHKASDGSLECLSTVMRDITERKFAETALRESYAEFRNLTEAMPQIVWIMKADGTSTYFNQHWIDYTGLTLETSLGQGWRSSFHPDDLQRNTDAWLHAAATTDVFSMESRLRRSDGVYRWWLIRGVPQTDAAGNVLKWFGTCTDIHDMKEAVLQISSANRSLLESERRFSDMLGNVTLATVMLDCEARITFCNEYLLRLSGWRLEEVIGKNWFELFLPADQRHRQELFDSALRTEHNSWHDESQILTRTGERRLVRWNTSLLRSGAGAVAGTASIGEDITNQKRDESEILTLNATLEQRVIDRTADLEHARNDAMTANQAKSSFLAAMSHEIRTPMNGVIGMVEVLHESRLNPDQMEMVDLIRDSGFALLNIIDDILDFSKIEAGRLQVECLPFALADVVEKACGVLDQLAVKNNVECTLFIDPALPEIVAGDDLRLRQVLLNLLSNAIKFSSGRDQAGKVRIQVLLTKRTADRIEVEIQVIDNGIGMDDLAQKHLFSAFTQADTTTTRRFGGTGLGLAISRHLVELMEGDIALHSELGKGSTFTVNLSFSLPDDISTILMPAPRNDTAAALSQVAGLCCVAIGAPEGLSEQIAAYLAADGARVERAATPAQACELLRRLPRGLWIWIIDCGHTYFDLAELRGLAGTLPQNSTRFVLIGRGQCRVPHWQSSDLVAVDGNLLTRSRLRSALAMVTGHAMDVGLPAPAINPAGTGRSISREEALRHGQLILVAEDNNINQKVILRQLGLLGFAADVVDNGIAALRQWQSGSYALLFTDLHMPHMDGYELAAAVRSMELDQPASGVEESSHASRKRLTIIALTANALKGEADRCRDAGMDDYLSKPLQLTQLKKVLEKWMPPPASSEHRVEQGHSPLRSLATPIAGPGTTSITAVDVSVLAMLIGNDPAVILEFLDDFRLSAAEIAHQLRSACRDGRSKQASDQAHKLKSSALAVGALALGECCAAIEAAGNAGQVESLATLWNDFEREFDRVNRFLDSRKASRPDRWIESQ